MSWEKKAQDWSKNEDKSPDQHIPGTMCGVDQRSGLQTRDISDILETRRIEKYQSMLQ
jgi:hypothetical protein